MATLVRKSRKKKKTLREKSVTYHEKVIVQQAARLAELIREKTEAIRPT